MHNRNAPTASPATPAYVLARTPMAPVLDVEGTLPADATLAEWRRARANVARLDALAARATLMRRVRRTLTVLAWLVLPLAVAALLAAGDAEAAALHHCKAQGALVGADAATAAPDFLARLLPGERVTVPLGMANATTDLHAYGYDGEPTRQYACWARHHVDQWLEWRDSAGRVRAKWDGRTWTAVRRTQVTGWTG